jgi:hypothetical protein
LSAATGIEPLLVKLRQAVVTPAVKRWLTDRRQRREHALPLADLAKLTDGLARRRFDREVEAMADAVAERLAPLGGTLPDHERRAALAAVVDAFTAVADTDEAFFAADADPDKLSALVQAKASAVPARAGLSEPAAHLYRPGVRLRYV